MKLRATGFSLNGRGNLIGTLVAVGVDGEPLGFEHSANFSDIRERDRFVKALVKQLDVDEDRARAALAEALKEVRRACDSHAASQANEEQGQRGPGSPAERLIHLVADSNAILFLDDLDVPHVAPLGSGREVWSIDSRKTRRWLSRLLYDDEQKAPSGDAMHTAILYLEAQAEAGGIRHGLEVRVAKPGDGEVWYDLGAAAIRVLQGHWSMVEHPPVLFTRFPHQLAQVPPVPGGDFDLLSDFIPIASTDDWLLLKVAIIASLVPGTPRPIIVFHGPEGSGKTSSAKVVVMTIDPSAAPTIRRLPKPEELAQRFAHSWAVAFDNISYFSPEVQDAISAAVTGDADLRRVLYTTADDHLMTFRRVVIITGLGVPLTLPDALDRSLLIGLKWIAPKDRQRESVFWERFNHALPSILGGAFDILARALELLPAVRIAELPRMADFAELGYAVAEAGGWGGDVFLAAYQRNINQQHQEAIAASIVAQTILKLMEELPFWEGTPTELKRELDTIASGLGIDIGDKKGGWPPDATRLGTALRRVAETLGAVGIVVEFDRDGQKRTYRLIREG